MGYGAAFEGLAALLTMLDRLRAGRRVVNIDNGFGAGVAAARIVRRSPGSRTGPSGGGPSTSSTQVAFAANRGTEAGGVQVSTAASSPP